MNWVASKKIKHKNVIQKIMEDTCEKTNQYTNGGPIVKELEEFIRNKFEIQENKAVICCNNATSALYALTSGIELVSDVKQWATQSFTFPASAQGMLKDAIIIDIDEGGGVDLNQIPEEVNGIIVTNCFGNVVDIDKYVNWCKERNIFLILDNAGTGFTFYKGKNSCNYGHGSVISFHHTKQFGFGEGGAIIVDEKYEYTIRKLMNFGIDNNNPNEYELYWNRLGNNYKISEISALYILQYLRENFDNIVEHHRKLYDHFKETEKEGKIKLYPNFADECMTVPMCISLLNKKYTEEFTKKLLNNGYYCRKYYHPLICSEKSYNLHKRILCLPCNLDINSQEYPWNYL
jgi:dTDP-4-amino-4,6-dideoxygalactose transaminase